MHDGSDGGPIWGWRPVPLGKVSILSHDGFGGEPIFGNKLLRLQGRHHTKVAIGLTMMLYVAARIRLT